jgi:hypothetical protein
MPQIYLPYYTLSMQYLSVKEANNQPTTIYRKSNLFSFMNLSNQRLLTKKIYFLHKSNNGLLPYLHFKSRVPRRMKEWVNTKEINPYNEIVLGGADVLDYLNKKFISDNYDLHNFDQSYVPLESNVYKNKLTIAFPSSDEKHYIAIEKTPSDLLAEDYRNLDLWSEQTTEITAEHQRYYNKIPFWQRTMNKRHYDRGNQGYHHADPNRASLDTPIYGYGTEIDKLAKSIDEKNKRNGVFSV